MPILLALLLSVTSGDLDSLKRKFEQEKQKKAEDRQATIVALGKLQTTEAADFLIGAFEKERDPAVRKYAIQALAACGTPNAVKHLLTVAERSSADDEERAWALDSAVWTGSEVAAALAASMLTGRRESNWLREMAGRALLRFRPIEKTEKTWRKVLSDEVADIRAQALQALAPLKDSQVLALARTALLDPKHAASVRRAAVEAWRVKGGIQAVRLLLDVPVGGDGALRSALVGALAKMIDDDSFDDIAAEIPKAAPEMRAVAAWALGKSSHVKSIHVLQKLIADPNAEVRIAAMEAAAERGSDEVCTLLKIAAQKGEDETAEAAVSLLSGFPYPDTVELLARLAGQAKRVSFKVAAIDSLARIGRAEAFPVFETGLTAREWQVRAASIHGLSRMKRVESVDLLIGRMTSEEGRLAADLVTALKSLTGKSLGFNPDHWKDWWKANREKFSFENPSREGEEGGGGTTTYHNIPVFSKKMAFLLDVSGSMREKSGDTTRLGEAKVELVKVLRALAKDARVNLIFFNGQVDPWQPRLVTIGPNLAKAVAAVEALKAGGGTNIYDTLEKAIEDSDVDTIYLLSDGAPSVGKFTAAADVLREVRRMNRKRQIAIHTISLGKSSFMKNLAAENDGQYREVK